ncbi:Protein kinase domain-containing protein [Aphelenchoides besseyi]|nr:Protein kinase domain-containing protein [Aphelenchoides besseyi]
MPNPPQRSHSVTTGSVNGTSNGNKEQIAKNFGRSFIELIENFLDEKEHVSVLHTVISALNINTEIRTMVLKKILMHFLRKFSNDEDDLRLNDEYICKVLQLWKIFGQCSNTMSPSAIWEKIEDQFADCWQFYKNYAECLIDDNITDKVYEVFKKCMENCELSEDEVRKRFGPAIMEHVQFPSSGEDDEGTVNFLQAIRQNDVRKSLAARRRSSLAPARLDVVFERSEDNTPVNRPAEPKRRSPIPPCPRSPTLNYSVASSRPAFQDTTQYTGRIPPAYNQQPPRDSFTVFKDPTVVRMAATQRPSTQPVHSPTTQSPVSKRGRINESLDISDVKPNMISEELQSAQNGANKENGEKRNSFDPNSPTVCGLHKPSANRNHLTSTPNSSIRFAKVTNKRKTLGLFDQPPGRLSVGPQSTTKSITKPSHLSANPPQIDLQLAVDRMHLGNSSETLEATGNGNVSLEFQGTLNPWNEEAREDMLRRNLIVVQQHDFTDEKAPLFQEGRECSLGGERFRILKQIGQGGFAKVFKCDNDGRLVAVKYQVPPCPFEVHMVESIRRVMPETLKGFLMDLQDAYIFKDASAIVYEYLPYGTLLDLANTYRIQGRDVAGMVISLVGLQLGRVLKHIHDMSIIHGDTKPDNILICGPLPENMPFEKVIGQPLIRLIDFGRAIDMQYYRGQTFTGKAKTQCFDCIEMMEGRPWTYQTDLFGFVSVIYLLMHHQYMKVKKDENGVYKTWHPVKRRMTNGDLWTKIFEKFLNIPSCSNLPDWSIVLYDLETEFSEAVRQDPAAWKQSIVWLNKMIKCTTESVVNKK